MLFLLFLLLGYDSGSLSGFVTDATNGEKLAYANLYLEDTELGSASNEKGYFVIHDVPSGEYTLICSYVGYQGKRIPVHLKKGEHQRVNIELTPLILEMPEVSVSAQRSRFDQEVEVSHITFTTREIKSVPGLFEKDLIKILQLMPGIVAMHDLSNKLYVRGGSPDENLVLLDGITVYNPSTHLFGLFSTFNPDAVGDAELYAGGYPARFGNRLSSVLNITTKEGNTKKYSGKFNLGLITSKALVEGPIPKGSFLVSGRRTYFDGLVWVYSKITGDTISLPYYFYDGIAKVNFNPTMNDRFTLAGLGGSDVVSFENFDEDSANEKIELNWGNRGTSLRWRRIFSHNLYGELQGSWSNFFTHFRYEDYSDTTNNLHFYEEIIDHTIKSDFNYFINQSHNMDWGIDIKHLSIEYNLEQTEHHILEKKEKTYLYSLYLQDKWSIIPHLLSLQSGLRAVYTTSRKKLSLDPRLGIKYHLSPSQALNLAWGKYSQYLITINSQESYFSIFDFWRLVDTLHALPNAYHVIVGYENWLDENTHFTIEPYYKRYYNLLIPPSSEMLFSRPAESLAVSRGYAFGVDLFFKKTYKSVFGWFSYSFGYTRRKLGDRYYAPRYDRRHNLNIVIGFTVPGKLPVISGGALDLRWYLGSGLPYAEDLARYRYRSYDYLEQEESIEWLIIRGPRDARRLPVSHRLDLHFEKDFKLFGKNGSWFIDVINLYDRENVLFYTWDYDKDPPRKTAYILLPIPIPSIGINMRF